MKDRILTKTHYMTGLACPKCLWITLHQPEKVPEHDRQTLHRFDQGQRIGDMAKKMFPGGVDIQAKGINDNAAITRDLLADRKVLFEAGVLKGRLFSRADILVPVGKDEWDLIEVKSSGSVKDDHLHDVSFQRHCWERSGISIRKCFLMHVDSSYVRKGGIDPKGLLAKEDITDEVKAASEGIEDRIRFILEIMDSKKMPDIPRGLQCGGGKACRIGAPCWEELPDNSVFNLYHMGPDKAFELYDSGVKSIDDIPHDYKLNAKQDIQKECHRTGKPYVDKAGIRRFLETLEYPLYYLDFETYGTPIPIHEGTRPFQNIPFQFSLHIQKSPGAKPEHHSYLAPGPEDPRKELLAKLKALIGPRGSIVVFNKSFEKRVLSELGAHFPKEKWISSLEPRLVDLIVPFRSFHYYHPKQCGSCSLKAVLPAVTGKGYDKLAIQDGQDASLDFLYLAFGDPEGKKPTPEEAKKIRSNLEAYCGLDTLGMVWIVGELGRI